MVAAALTCRADVTVTVAALDSGYSSAVHGLLRVVDHSRAPRVQVLQYKALDSGVHCLLLGDSL